MDSEKNNFKVWTRFESKKQDGSIIKLRIQNLPNDRLDDLMTFLTTYYVKDESLHKAAGIYDSNEATQEYKRALRQILENNLRHIAICCLDNDSEDFEEILAASTGQVIYNNAAEGSVIKKDIEPQTEEMKTFYDLVTIMKTKVPESLKEKYEMYYLLRGIIVHPDYRCLGTASQFLKQRRLLCNEDKVSMTGAWMTSIGTQKAAEREGWKTVAEVKVDELSSLTGLKFDNDVPTYKMMLSIEQS